MHFVGVLLKTRAYCLDFSITTSQNTFSSYDVRGSLLGIITMILLLFNFVKKKKTRGFDFPRVYRELTYAKTCHDYYWNYHQEKR